MTNTVLFGTLPPSPNSTYAWSYVSGGLPTVGTNSVFPSLGPTSNGGLTTLATLVTVIPTLNGCQGPDNTFTIFVYPNPQANFTYNTVCLGQTTSFTNSSIPNTGVNAVVNWSWDMNGDGLFGDATGPNPPFTFSTAGTQTVSLLVTTNPTPALTNGHGGCADTITQNPFVNPLPVANFYGDSVGCPTLSTQFYDNSSVTIGGVPVGTIVSWTWSFNSSNSKNPITYNTPIVPILNTYPNTSPTQLAVYPVSLSVTTAAGCSSSKTVSQYIKVYPRPVADFAWAPTTADIVEPTINFSNQAIGANQYSVTNQYGKYGVEYYLGDTYVTNDSLNYAYNNTIFSHAYNDSDPNDVVETYSVTQWVINQYGCTDSIMIPVTIQPIVTFYIPNAFTPNGDGKNEGFKGEGIGIDISTYNMWIFDRWGLMIYYTTDLNQTWDGHMKGDDGRPTLQEDVYVWKVKFHDIFGKYHEYHGTVTLLK